MERQKYNKLILETLSKLINKYPDLRFGQILVNSEIVQVTATSEGVKCQDPFYEEPEVIWERMKNNKFVFPELFN
jgi:hypothetical protein